MRAVLRAVRGARACAPREWSACMRSCSYAHEPHLRAVRESSASSVWDKQIKSESMLKLSDSGDLKGIYRLQHMSNGVLYDSNPGLNMHMIEMGYRF